MVVGEVMGVCIRVELESEAELELWIRFSVLDVKVFGGQKGRRAEFGVLCRLRYVLWVCIRKIPLR